MFVYIWKSPEGEPFYVGMTKSAGRTNPLNTGGRGWLCKQTLEKIGRTNVIVEVHYVSTLEEAIALEKKLILQYGRIQLSTGTLTNLKPGGDGAGGMSPEGREATRKRMKGNNPAKRPEVRAKIKHRMSQPDVKIKFMGENNPAKRPEVRAKIQAKWADPKFKEAQRQRKLGKSIHSETAKEQRRQLLLNPNHPIHSFNATLNSDPVIKEKRVATLQTPEVRAKISASLKLSWGKRKGVI